MSILTYFRKPQPKLARIFIDTDNQPFTLASGLQDYMDNLGRKIQFVVLAGNAHGDSNNRWKAELKRVDPTFIVTVTVPQRENAADAAILMMLGRSGAYIKPDDLVVIVSRDRLLAEAALQLQENGIEVLMISQEGGTHPRATGVPTLVLPCKTPSYVQETHDVCDEVGDTSTDAILALVKKHVPVINGNLYLSSQVHDVLVAQGMTDKEVRRTFIKQIPGLSSVTDDRAVTYYYIP